MLTAYQGVLYASTSLKGDAGFSLLNQAITSLLAVVQEGTKPVVLYSMQYEQRSPSSRSFTPGSANRSWRSQKDTHIITFPPVPLDLAFDDSVLENVRKAWEKIMGAEAKDLMVFEDREAINDDSDDNM